MPAKSEQQRKLFAAALGKHPKGAAMKIKKTVSKKKIKEFAKKESMNKQGNVINESLDKIYVRNLISHICNKDFAEANKNLELAIREKTKKLIQKETV